MSLFSGKVMLIAGAVATLALSFQLGVFYGPERRDALYREYSGAGRVAAVAALRPALARITQTALSQVQAAAFIETPAPGAEIQGEYGRPTVALEQRACDSAAKADLARAASSAGTPGPAPVVVASAKEEDSVSTLLALGLSGGVGPS
ncbi:hypothetical protein [Caulobacter soli]|uniref:hypothetical protein n=1 Tax=Caulobacter soli TaxID=2708539 RepID=UPI0013ED1A51|nr:hypothetical protein [Caulobacter soli]